MPTMQNPIGKVFGKVLDAETKKPVEYATVTLLFAKNDSLITGTLVKSNGDFLIDKLKFGAYKVRVEFLGYKKWEQSLVINPKNSEIDLGNLKLAADVQLLNAVEIEGEKNVVQLSIDRKVYSPDKDLTTRGGTGVDVMKNVPGVSVDADGGVTLRNSTPTIFVDGRPTNMSLDQIPADQIEKVEVITNPSAKFDASTTGGILNVVLKKNTKPGYNGMLGFGIGNNDRYNFNGNLNLKEGKWNLALSYNINTAINNNDALTDRENFNSFGKTGSFNQNTLNRVNRLFNFGRIGIDYSINNRSTISVSQNIGGGRINVNDKQHYEYLSVNDSITEYGDRFNDQKNSFNNYTSQISYRYNFPKKGRELTTDLTYNYSIRNNNSEFTTYGYGGNDQLFPNNPLIQKNEGSGNVQGFTYQLDFTNPLNDSSKIEMGLRTNFGNNKSSFRVDNFDYATSALVYDSLQSNFYTINDNVSAAYVNYSSRIWGLNYSAGLRFESTNFKGIVEDKNLSFEYIYPSNASNIFKSLFPSVYISKKKGMFNEFQLNFSRKISRPGFMQIMPFIMFSNRDSYRIGNPTLAPEFYNLAEANYSRIFSKGSLLTSLYFKHTEDVITQYVYPLASDPSILVTTFVNGKNSFTYGWENTGKYTLIKNLDLTLNLNIFYTSISSANNGASLNNEGLSWNAKATLAYKLPKDFTVQLNGTYEAPRFIPQGKTIEVYFMDASISKNVTKKLSLSLTLSDAFNTKRFGNVFETSTFIQDSYRRWETRFVRFNLSYRFGEMDMSIFRRKGTQRREPGSNSGGDMDF